MLRKRDLMVKGQVCGLDTNGKIEEIRNCERDIKALYEQESEDKIKVFRTYTSLLKPFYNERSKIIESIPKFWATAIEYHPKMTYLITEEVTDVLKYVSKLEVNNTDTTYFKITLVFEENPYIENKVIIKELSSCNNTNFVSVSTPINWKTNQTLDNRKLQTKSSGKRKWENTSFFTWFCDDDIKDQNIVVNCFDEIWQNPLPFFLLGIMDNEVDYFTDVDNCDIEIDTNEDDNNVFDNDDSISEAIDDDNCWSEHDEDESEEEEEEEERDEVMDYDSDEEV